MDWDHYFPKSEVQNFCFMDYLWVLYENGVSRLLSLEKLGLNYISKFSLEQNF